MRAGHAITQINLVADGEGCALRTFPSFLNSSCVPQITSCNHYMCSKGGFRGSVCLRMGVCTPPTAPTFEAIHACREKHPVFAIFAAKEGFAVILFAGRSWRPPPPQPPVFDQFMRAAENIMSSLCLQQGRALRIILFAHRGTAFPQSPRFFKQSMLAAKSILSLLCLQ